MRIALPREDNGVANSAHRSILAIDTPDTEIIQDNSIALPNTFPKPYFSTSRYQIIGNSCELLISGPVAAGTMNELALEP